MHIGQPKAPMFKHLQLFSKGHGLGMEVYHHLQKTPQTCPADLPIRGTKYRKVLHISVESNWSIVQSIIGAFMLWILHGYIYAVQYTGRLYYWTTTCMFARSSLMPWNAKDCWWISEKRHIGTVQQKKATTDGSKSNVKGDCDQDSRATLDGGSNGNSTEETLERNHIEGSNKGFGSNWGVLSEDERWCFESMVGWEGSQLYLYLCLRPMGSLVRGHDCTSSSWKESEMKIPGACAFMTVCCYLIHLPRCLLPGSSVNSTRYYWFRLGPLLGAAICVGGRNYLIDL